MLKGIATSTAGGRCNPDYPELGKTGALVADEPNAMRDYTYMSDHMGNIVGLVDCENETGHRQVFDAFGNVIGDFVLLHCAADHDWTDIPCHLARIAGQAPPVCPRPPAEPIARMQTGGFNWRGNEGSITDRVAEDMVDSETYQLRWSSDTRPSTGFVYMQARYYEPATGRFLTADPVPYGLETVLTGQNNRWVYCGNDPVNASDPSGECPQLVMPAATLAITAAVLFSIGFALGLYYSGCTVGGPLQAVLLTLLDIVLAAVASQGIAALASVLVVSLGPILIMTGALLAVFLAGFFLGKFVGELLAYDVDASNQEDTRVKRIRNDDPIGVRFAYLCDWLGDDLTGWSRPNCLEYSWS